jgi:hypothetical protein
MSRAVQNGAGDRSTIEDYLDRLPGVDRAVLLGELLASELALREERREPCEREAYSI